MVPIDYKPRVVSLAKGPICRGDTIRSWAFAIGIGAEVRAEFEFSVHLKNFGADAIFVARTDGLTPTIQQAQIEPDKRVIVVPAWNVPIEGQIVWDLDWRLPDVSTANGVFTLTLCKGSFLAIQDGAGRER